MAALTDRQRIELAIPAYLFYALTGVPKVFVPTDPNLATRAEADIAELRGDLHAACLEPFADLTAAKRQALLRRLDRIKIAMTADWDENRALDLMLMLWNFLVVLTDRKILFLWEGSAMDRAMQRLLPMCEVGVEKLGDSGAPQEQGLVLLSRLQAQGLYR